MSTKGRFRYKIGMEVSAAAELDGGKLTDIWGEEEMAQYLKPQDNIAEDRERYRRGRKDTAVKVRASLRKASRSREVYTIVEESRYLVARNLPAVGGHKELVQKFALYGPIEEWRMLDQTDGGVFTDVLWIKFRTVEEAKTARKHLDDSLFYAHPLHVTYAPEYESEAETWEKLQLRRMAVTSRLAAIASSGDRVPERGKQPRYVERQRTVLKPIDHQVLPFAAPKAANDDRRANAALIPPPPPPRKVPIFGGTFEDTTMMIRDKLRRVEGGESDSAPMPQVRQAKRGGRWPKTRI